MTRFFVIFTVFFAMYWSWFWVHAPERDKQFFIHGALKERVQKMLGEAILIQRPQAREIEFISLWTKVKSPREIHLFFTYRFIDDLMLTKELEAVGVVAEPQKEMEGENEMETTEADTEADIDTDMDIKNKAQTQAQTQSPSPSRNQS